MTLTESNRLTRYCAHSAKKERNWLCEVVMLVRALRVVCITILEYALLKLHRIAKAGDMVNEVSVVKR